MIKGKSINLRELRHSDLPSINRWRNNLRNRVVTQGFRGPVTIDVDSVWLEKVLKNENDKDYYFGIEKKESEDIVGIIQLNAVDFISGVATCGILIGEDEERGSGLGVDAVRALLYYAFFILNLRKVITYVASFNEQAFRVQNKVGKVYEEGCLKAHYMVNGEFIDLHIQSFFKDDYVILKNEYTI